jgi:hypothetical protein
MRRSMPVSAAPTSSPSAALDRDEGQPQSDGLADQL